MCIVSACTGEGCPEGVYIVYCVCLRVQLRGVLGVCSYVCLCLPVRFMSVCVYSLYLPA